MGGRAHVYKEFIMETFDMSNFVTEEELENAEKANEQAEQPKVASDIADLI